MNANSYSNGSQRSNYQQFVPYNYAQNVSPSSAYVHYDSISGQFSRPVLRRNQSFSTPKNSQLSENVPPVPPRQPQFVSQHNSSREYTHSRTSSFSSSKDTRGSTNSFEGGELSNPYRKDRPLSTPCYDQPSSSYNYQPLPSSNSFSYNKTGNRPLPMVNYQTIDRSCDIHLGRSKSFISPIVHRDTNSYGHRGPMYGHHGSGYMSEGADAHAMDRMRNVPILPPALGGTGGEMESGMSHEQRVFRDGISAIKDCLLRSDIKLAESDR